jgi:hypothetical protein
MNSMNQQYDQLNMQKKPLPNATAYLYWVSAQLLFVPFVVLWGLYLPTRI